MTKRGRPALTAEEQMAAEGRYLTIRMMLQDRDGHPPTNAEIAEYMGVSLRTVSTIRERERERRRWVFRVTGADARRDAGLSAPGTPTDFSADIDGVSLLTWAGVGAKGEVGLAYLTGYISTAEAARRLDIDERSLRRWRERVRQEGRSGRRAPEASE